MFGRVCVGVIPFLLIGPALPFHLGSPLDKSYGQDQKQPNPVSVTSWTKWQQMPGDSNSDSVSD